MLTLIIDGRLREGAEDIGAIPKTQNGFQAFLRTNSNPFVLLCLIDKAEALGKPLYVAYLDFKNAFRGTDRSTLWGKLEKLGITGPMIEWLKNLVSFTDMLWLVKYDLDRANGAILAKKPLPGDTIEEDEEVEEVPAPRRQVKGGEG
ncbi:hypothetical protein B0H14DRAFT_3455221 [Mycena olivaceomarginata]|nr:hypothetical protein B0H14DRAFT_3455221 [Mycena olivaceomarginata]